MLERFRYLIFGAVILAIAAGIVALLTYHPAPVVITIIPPAPTVTYAPTLTPSVLKVYVTGAVANGEVMYSLPPGSRIQDAIDAAGGIDSDADLVHINMAQVLHDGDQINVPSLNSGSSKSANSADAAPTLSGPIHINTASADELQTLSGVGPSLAQAIIDYRTKHGPFKSMSDLDNVPGIGPAKIAAWQDKIAFD